MTKHCSLREPIDNPFKAGTFALPDTGSST